MMALNISMRALLKYWKPVSGCMVVTVQLECFVCLIHAGVVAIILHLYFVDDHAMDGDTMHVCVLLMQLEHDE